MTPEELAVARAKDKAYNERHREEKAAATRAWRLANPDKGYSSDPERFKANTQRYRDNNRKKVRALDLQAYHERRRFQKYGITKAIYESMWADQKGKCAICPRDLDPKRCCIDHDHACCPVVNPKATQIACGKCVRGLLCNKCNIGIGHLDDDPEKMRRAGVYVQRAQTRLRALKNVETIIYE